MDEREPGRRAGILSAAIPVTHGLVVGVIRELSRLGWALPNLPDQVNRCRNFAQAPATSGELRMADTTQMRVAPAARTESRFWSVMPPIANQGMEMFDAAQVTYSSVTAGRPGLVPVGNTGPTAT